MKPLAFIAAMALALMGACPGADWLTPERADLRPDTGSAPAGDLMHAHRWKRGAKETEATVREIHRKAAKIAPAYNKGAMQYLPDTPTSSGGRLRFETSSL